MFDSFGGRVGQLANQPADRLLDSADLVVTVGYNPVEYWPPEWNAGKQRKVIHIDVLSADLDNCYQPSVELTGDIAQTLAALTPQVSRPRASALSASMLEAIVAERRHLAEEAARRSGTLIHPLRRIHEIKEFLSPDTTVCLDVGSFYLWIALPWGIAASIVRPSEKILAISGDGGFLFSAMELETAVRLNANLVHMVWIDGRYDMVATQEKLKYGRMSGVDLGPIDYIKYAEAFGAKGLMIKTPDDIAPVMRNAFDTPGPVIVGVHVDYRDNHKLFEMLKSDNIH